MSIEDIRYVWPQLHFCEEDSPLPCAVYSRKGDWPGIFLTSARTWEQLHRILVELQDTFLQQPVRRTL